MVLSTRLALAFPNWTVPGSTYRSPSQIPVIVQVDRQIDISLVLSKDNTEYRAQERVQTHITNMPIINYLVLTNIQCKYQTFQAFLE